ncbi:helix-turn-helix transcriptional regulator [Anaerobacillus sp. MEB173]|uniref:helix-turn-helix transcriptional regulator n=1 Tax=Anaerobacillus sp. MEB173 TaxID=3383345 RepID=UPI003F92415E
MSKQTTSTRDEILGLLKMNKQMTVAEMAENLGITEMAIRRHLNSLERDHVVETTLVRQAMGRPSNVYSLSKKGEELFPRNYATLTVDFLKDIEELNGPEMVEALFERRKERFKEQYSKRIENKSFEEKIEELAKIQNEHGYMVEWEKEEDGTYIFKEYNCPISQIAEEYPVACKCELSLFREMLGTDEIECSSSLAIGDGPNCFYRIKKPKDT